MSLRTLLAFIGFATMLLQAPVAFSQSGETPPSIEGAKTVTPADIKNILGKALVLDVRKKASYLEGRIPGAKSITAHFDAEKKTFATAAFGSDKSAIIVIYGHGSDGWSAVHATRSAVAGGYSNVLWLRTGWVSWAEQKMPVEQ